MDYAEKLTISPRLCSKKDISALKDNKFTDQDILQINLTVSYFNFVNRIALGLGVEIESDWSQENLTNLQIITNSWKD